MLEARGSKGIGAKRSCADSIRSSAAADPANTPRTKSRSTAADRMIIPAQAIRRSHARHHTCPAPCRGERWPCESARRGVSMRHNRQRTRGAARRSHPGLRVSSGQAAGQGELAVRPRPRLARWLTSTARDPVPARPGPERARRSRTDRRPALPRRSPGSSPSPRPSSTARSPAPRSGWPTPRPMPHRRRLVSRDVV